VHERELIVVKCGGDIVGDPAGVCADVAWLAASGRPIVLVHGGAADIDGLADRLRVPSTRMTSPDGLSARFTDQAMLEVVSMALAGLVQPRLVTAMNAVGVSAVGLTGVHGRVLTARRRGPQRTIADGRQLIVRGDNSGRITSVNTVLLECLINAGFVPVLSPPVLADDGLMVNADADRVAAAVASALRASVLILLTGTRGVLADPANPESMMPVCPVPRSGPPPHRGGGMGVKLLAARDVLVAGVPTVLIADGSGPHPVRAALSGAATRVILAGSSVCLPS
jgi:acetylglutamate/LysW-gamma-L-alpha-aminoadipate kinase